MAKTILIVEDDPRNLTLFRDLLRVSGYETLEATDGKEGIESAKANVPDLILMDIQMPVLGGLEATRILKADSITCDIPIVALTASAMKGDEEKTIEAGCDRYMAKPVDVKEFLKLVAEYFPDSPGQDSR